MPSRRSLAAASSAGRCGQRTSRPHLAEPLSLTTAKLASPVLSRQPATRTQLALQHQRPSPRPARPLAPTTRLVVAPPLAPRPPWARPSPSPCRTSTRRKVPMTGASPRPLSPPLSPTVGQHELALASAGPSLASPRCRLEQAPVCPGSDLADHVARTCRLAWAVSEMQGWRLSEQLAPFSLRPKSTFARPIRLAGDLRAGCRRARGPRQQGHELTRAGARALLPPCSHGGRPRERPLARRRDRRQEDVLLRRLRRPWWCVPALSLALLPWASAR